MTTKNLRKYETSHGCVGVMRGDRNYTVVTPTPDIYGFVCLSDATHAYVFAPINELKLTPLCYIDSKPVYEGDTLYYKVLSDFYPHVVSRVENTKVFNKDGGFVFEADLDWEKPLTKKSGWAIFYDSGATSKIYATKEEAENAYYFNDNRFRVVEVHWEE